MNKHFDFLAPLYENFIKPRSPETLITLLDLPIQGALLDIGGGTGRVSGYLTSQAAKVIVADVSPKMLLQSLEKPGLMPVCTHAEQLPFPDSYFDRVIMVDALHHVCSQTDTARELWRILKPAGRIIIEEPDIAHWGVKLVALGEKVALMRSHFLSPRKIKGLFAGYTKNLSIHSEGHISWITISKD